MSQALLRLFTLSNSHLHCQIESSIQCCKNKVRKYDNYTVKAVLGTCTEKNNY